MLWSKTLRSPSPPGLGSSSPEMEHRLATVDSAAPHAIIDHDNGSSAMSEGPAAQSSPHQDHNETQAADFEPVPKPDQQPATAEDDTKRSACPKHEWAELKALTRKRAQRSRPHLLVLLTCVSYLFFQFLGVDLGLRLVHGYIEPRLNRAEVQLQAALSSLVIERIVHHKLDAVLGSTLQPQYHESYEHCLARGLSQADKIFFGIDFTPYPDARNQTMDWVMDNCDRLHYAPQTFTPYPSKLLAIVATMRRSAEETLALFKYKALLLRCKFRGRSQPLTAKQTPLQSNQNTNTSFKAPTKMPFGISLDCEGRSRCRLIHSGPSFSSNDRKSSLEATTKASNEIQKWTYSFDKLLYITGYIVKLLATLQAILFGNQLAAILVSYAFRARPAPAPGAFASTAAQLRRLLRDLIASLTRDEKLAPGLIVNSFAYTLLHYELSSVSSEFDRLLLPVGLAFCAFHVPQAIAFFNPVPWKALNAPNDVHSFCRAVRDLYLIARDTNTSDQPLETEQNGCCPLRRTPAAASNTGPASKIGARFISPLTSISEDLQQERKALHAELGKETRDDEEDLSGYATETEEEYDSDVQHASYVDLTGGATPMVSEREEEGEWAVVED